jgi:subfamily B ATP-binding cassette protein MsbA
MLRYARPYAGPIALAMVCAFLFAGGRIGRAALIQPIFDDVLGPTYAAASDTGATPSHGGILDWFQSEPSAQPESHAGSTGARPASRAWSDIRPDQRAALVRVSYLALAIVIVMPLAMMGRSYLFSYTLGRVSMDIQRQLARKLLALPLSFHRTTRTGDTLARALNDAEKSQVSLEVFLAESIQASMTVAVGAIWLISISWQLTTLSSIIAPAVVWLLLFFSRKIQRTSRKRQMQFGEVTQRLMSILMGIKVIKAFRGEELENNAFGHETETLFRRNMKVVKNRALSHGSIEALNNAMAVGLILLGAVLILTGRLDMTVGQLGAYAMVLAMTYKPIKTLSRGWTKTVESLASADRFFQIMDLQEEPADPPAAITIDGIHRSIRFRDVSFSYDRDPVLRNVSLNVDPGEVIAIVGRTGQGKSTLVDLLLRFNEPASGSIQIDGVDLRNISRESFLDQIAVVAQEPFLFDTTIRENIRYGREGASDADFELAVRAAHVDEFVDQLPQGYETPVGEFGLQLSGGQRQRITIARALMKDPAILVFDEATSSLDAKTERIVQDAIEGLRGKRTVFVIAHRLSTIRSADRVLVIEGGTISESGSHDELMAGDGLYREMVDLQLEIRGVRSGFDPDPTL